MGAGGLAADPKKAQEARAHIVLIDETGLFLNPLVRRSWAPRGHTPVIGGDGGHRKKVSVIGAVSVSPADRRVGLYFGTLAGGFFNAPEVVGFLRDLLRCLRGNVLVVWDRGQNHKGPVVRGFLGRNRRVWLEALPSYAPELNPTEQVWGWLKYGQLANFVPADLTELEDEVMERLVHLKLDPALLRALWDGSGLPFPDCHHR